MPICGAPCVPVHVWHSNILAQHTHLISPDQSLLVSWHTWHIDQLYIGIKGDSRSPADVEVDVYNDLFPGSAEVVFNIHELQSQAQHANQSSVALFTPPTPAFVDGIDTATRLRYSLTAIRSGHLLPNFPFSVNPDTGEVRTTKPLVHAEKAVWSLDLRAQGTGGGDQGKCVRGFIKLIVNVEPSTTTTLTKTSSTQTTVTVTTVTTTTSRQLGPADFNAIQKADLGRCRLYNYVCKDMNRSIFVVADTIAGSNTYTASAKDPLAINPAVSVSATGANGTATSHSVLRYSPGYSFDDLQLSVCAESGANSE